MQSYSESKKRVTQIHELLQRGEPISDNDLIEAISHFFVMTNTLEAAKLELWAISPICARRPHLIEALLRYVIRPLFYTGFQTEHMIKWIQAELHDNPEAPFRISDRPALEWVQRLPTQVALIADQVATVEHNEHEINTSETQTVLKAHSHMPMDKIRFRYFWSERFHSGIEKFVVFIYFDDQKSQEAFAALTDIFTKERIGEAIPLFVVTGASYVDVLETYESANPELLANDESYAQILWIYKQEIIAGTKANEVEAELYLRYTRELLERSDSS